MRFIHMADMHFDSPFRLLGTQENFGNLRRIEQRSAMKKIIEKIKEENIPYLFIAGDLYENEYIRKTTIEYINNLFKEIPKTKIFIAPGNHDPLLKNSYYNNFNWNENVYIFNSEIQKYEFEECDIYGFGFTDFYCNNSKIEEIKIENKNKLNILIMHGDLNASQNQEMQYNPINENKLKKLGFDYVALGHIHKRDIKENIAYPGSCVSLGFNELGEHGVLNVNLEKGKLEINFEKIDEKEFAEINLDISEINSEEELIEKINTINLDENKFYKIILIGNKKIEINKNKIIKIINKKNILKIKDLSKIELDLNKIKEENNLKSFFIKEVLEMQKENNYTDEEIENAIQIGLQAIQN